MTPPDPSPVTSREHIYRIIGNDLLARMQAGEYPPGGLLPSESALMSAYGVSRVTVRKALNRLRREGAVAARHGSGWYVAEVPVRQSLARLGSLEEQLKAQGVVPTREILAFGVINAPREVQTQLGATRTLRVRRVSRLGDQPFARVTIWIPDELASHITRELAASTSFNQLIPVKCGGATQTIAARAASPTDARLLQIEPAAPVLHCTRLVTEQGSGRPVLFAQYVMPAGWTEFVVEIAGVEESEAPPGMRLLAAAR